MTTDTLTLTDFLLARIAEDLRRATREVPCPDFDPMSGYACGVLHTETDPRAKAECEAKRQIVAQHEQVSTSEGGTGCENCDWDERYGEVLGDEGPCPTVRILAAVYADHPDYREEWRVTS